MEPISSKMKNVARAKAVFFFYYNGFRDMPLWGRKLWVIIIIKLFIMFAILKLFLFPDLLKRNFDNDIERSNHVLEQITVKT